MNTSQNLSPPFTDEEHLQWRRSRANEQQRQRRARHRRIDYCPSEEAASIIDANTSNATGGDFSSNIDRIVTDWARDTSHHSGKN